MANYNTNHWTTRDENGILRNYEMANDAIETYTERTDEPAIIMSQSDVQKVQKDAMYQGSILGFLFTGLFGIAVGFALDIADTIKRSRH